MNDEWVVHTDELGDWVEIPAEAYAEINTIASIRGVSMSDVLADAWREFALREVQKRESA